MSNYFRITAYHPAKNICAIFDSNGRFEKLWQFSAYLVQKGFKIVEVGSDDKFLDGNIPKASVETLLILRACAKGQPLINGDTVEVNGKNYKPGTFTVQNNDCGKHVCTTKSAFFTIRLRDFRLICIAIVRRYIRIPAILFQSCSPI